MKREKTILLSSSSSSSSYRERGAAAATTATTPDGHSSCLHSQSIGCMSGLFHLLSRYQHRRKSLTYGKRQQKNTLVSPPTKDATADLVPALLRGGADGSRNDGSPAAADKRISCEVPRSPTLPAEIRRSRPQVGRGAPQPTPPPPTRPTVVARLMGLTAGDAPESAAEKRRELLGALDKCDRDLKALKRIIDVVRSAEQLRHEQGAAKPNASFDGRLQELAKEEEGGRRGGRGRRRFRRQREQQQRRGGAAAGSAGAGGGAAESGVRAGRVHSVDTDQRLHEATFFRCSSNAPQQFLGVPRRTASAATPEEEARRRLKLRHMPPGQDRLRALAGPGEERRGPVPGAVPIAAPVVGQRGHEAERGAGVQGYRLGPEEGGGKDRHGPARPHLQGLDRGDCSGNGVVLVHRDLLLPAPFRCL
ncbi:hypothetical protein NL676_001537 [Syzygium grande]|nr:hypothetical protein NL676_001537 [Syzygium grande]